MLRLYPELRISIKNYPPALRSQRLCEKITLPTEIIKSKTVFNCFSFGIILAIQSNT